MDSLKNYFDTWNKTKDSFAKVQSAYLAIAIVLFGAAAITSLVNPRLGQSVLFLFLVSLLVFIANGVVWSLVKTFIVDKTPSRKTTKPRK